MYHPTTRLLTILELLQSRGEMSGDALAAALQVEKRSIRRYIMMLRDMGIPIESDRGRHGGYSLRPGFRLPPMMFNADEITAVMVGLNLTRELGSISTTALESAAAKIGRVLPEELRQISDALSSTLLFDSVHTATYPISSEQIVELTLAAHRHQCLLITYQSAESETTQRLIAPYGLIQHTHSWYVPAYCYLRRDVRVFRSDRIRSILRSEETFVPPPDLDPRQTVLDSLARTPGSYTFEILIQAPLQTVQEIVPPSVAVLESRGSATLMRCYDDDPYWLARNLTRLELPFTVLATDELRDALRGLAQEILSAL